MVGVMVSPSMTATGSSGADTAARARSLGLLGDTGGDVGGVDSGVASDDDEADDSDMAKGHAGW